MESQKPENRRRYKRLCYYCGQDEQLKFEGAEMKWPNQEVSVVYDLSSQGAAIATPLDIDVVENIIYDFTLNLSNNESIELKGEVKWTHDSSVGIQFVGLDPESRKKFDKFMTDKLLGTYLYLVDKEHYPEINAADFWYHGPEETNIYFWLDGKKIKKLIVESGAHSMIYDEKGVKFIPVDSYHGVDGRYHNPSVEMGDEKISDAEVTKKTINLLAQLKRHQEALTPVYENLRRL